MRSWLHRLGERDGEHKQGSGSDRHKCREQWGARGHRPYSACQPHPGDAAQSTEHRPQGGEGPIEKIPEHPGLVGGRRPSSSYAVGIVSARTVSVMT